MMNCSTTSFNCLLSAKSLVFVVSVCFFFLELCNKILESIASFRVVFKHLNYKASFIISQPNRVQILAKYFTLQSYVRYKSSNEKNCIFSTSIKKIWFYLSKNWLSNCQLWHIYFASNRIIQELELIIVSYFGKRATHENSMRT